MRRLCALVLFPDAKDGIFDEIYFIDAVELTYESLQNRFDGHTGVALKDKATGRWILVDPTAHKILSQDWDPAATIYEDRYWIWYRGPWEAYPDRDPDSLRRAYDVALKAVPKEVWDSELVKIEFTIDDSMKLKDGGYTNPHLEEFLRRFSESQDRFGYDPVHKLKVRLLDAETAPVPADRDGCIKTSPDSWSCFVSRSSRMSPSSAKGPGFDGWLRERLFRRD